MFYESRIYETERSEKNNNLLQLQNAKCTAQCTPTDIRTADIPTCTYFIGVLHINLNRIYCSCTNCTTYY